MSDWRRGFLSGFLAGSVVALLILIALELGKRAVA